MPSSKLLKNALSQLPSIAVRRLRRGPEQPGWSPLYELAIAVARAGWNGSMSLAERRVAMDDAGRDELRRRRATFLDTELANRPTTWTTPVGGHDDAVVLYLHGGAYVVGSPHSHRPITAGLAEAACARVVAIDYRLAAEHPCPAAIDDAVAAYRALVECGTAPSRITIAGDSAGGGLALATLLALIHSGDPLPAAALLLSPWVDLKNDDLADNHPSDYIIRTVENADARAYAGELPLDDPRVSPIFADLTGLPPLFILAGGIETLRSDIERFARHAAEAHVPHTLHVEAGEVHVFPYFDAIDPRAAAAFRRMASWMREQLGRVS